MRREPVGAHADALHQAALHHVPAQRTLAEREQRQGGETQAECARNAPLHHEQEPRDGEHQSHRAGHVPVEPLPPVDPLELRQRDAGVGAAGLRDLLKLGELRRPCRVARRRQGARHRLPLGDGEPALGEPGDPAHRHGEEHRHDGEQHPATEREAVALRERAGTTKVVLSRHE